MVQAERLPTVSNMQKVFDYPWTWAKKRFIAFTIFVSSWLATSALYFFLYFRLYPWLIP